MKRFTLLVVGALLMTSLTFAQVVPFVKNNGHVIKSTRVLPFKLGDTQHGKLIVDTAGWTANFVPQFGAGASPITLYTIGMIDQNNHHIGYWFGTSGYASADSLEADWWAQCWINTTTYKIAGILFYAAGKRNMVGGSSSNVVMGVENMVAYAAGQHGCITGGTSPNFTFGPSPVDPMLASGTMNIADVDTTFANLNYIQFTTMPQVTSDFCAVSSFNAMRVNGDSCWMFADADGDGQQLSYSQYCLDPSGYYWVSCYFSTLDRNISMFAVIDNGSGIADEGYFNGFRMAIRQNPARENATIDYALQNDSKVKFEIWDAKGKTVAKVDEGQKLAGKYSFNVDISHLSPGMYFCSISSSNGGRLVVKLVIQ